MKKLCVAAIIMVIMSAGYTATAGETVCFSNAPDSELLKQVEANLFEYRNSNGRWPRDVKDLDDFARKKGAPLDLSVFRRLTIETRSADSVLVVYSIMKPEPYLAVYAITVREIHPPAEIRSVSDTSVRRIQVLLAQEGYDPGPVDGKIGNRTRDAIAQFERDNSLAAIGIPNAGLLELLEQKALKKLLKTRMWANGISTETN